MRHQFTEGEEHEKRLNPIGDGPKAGQEESDPIANDFAYDGIDPADFIDPEEFGFYRRGLNASRP